MILHLQNTSRLVVCRIDDNQYNDLKLFRWYLHPVNGVVRWVPTGTRYYKPILLSHEVMCIPPGFPHKRVMWKEGRPDFKNPPAILPYKQQDFVPIKLEVA